MNSIHRDYSLDGDKSDVIFVDAKQRAVVTSERPVVEQMEGRDFVQTYRAFCSEPSPDVFSVLAQAMSASGSFGQDTSSVKAALQAALSSSETGSTIPRTQTINMLREMMYRTCERYISGAMTPLDFSIQAVRDQHVMVSILAIEQLTGAVTPKPVAIGASGSAGAGQNTNDAIVRIDDAYKAWQTAEANVSSKQSAYDKLNAPPATPPAGGGTPVGACDAVAKTLKDNPNATLSPADAATNTQCNAALSDLNTSKAARDEAKAHYDELDKIAANGGTPVSAGTVNQISGAGDGGLSQAKPESVAAVASAVRAIVTENFDQSEMELMCVRSFESKSTLPRDVEDACVQLLKSSIDLRNARLEHERAETDALTHSLMDRTGRAMDPYTQTKFDYFWTKVVSSDADSADPAKLKPLVAALIATRTSWAPRDLAKLQALQGVTAKAEVFDKFKVLSLTLQYQLIALAK